MQVAHPFFEARAKHASHKVTARHLNIKLFMKLVLKLWLLNFLCRLVFSLVQSYPYPVLEHVSRLKELLDYFTFVRGNVASYLVAALAPLFKFNRDLRVNASHVKTAK